MKKKRSFIMGCLLLVAMLPYTFFASAQTKVTVKVEDNSYRVIRGKVTDAEGHSLPGVNVRVKGVQGGTVGDIDGNFMLSAPREDVVLIVSYIGMVTQEVTVKGSQKKEIQIHMKEDVNEVNEVVVTGYATLKKESFTGNTITVKKEELQKKEEELRSMIGANEKLEQQLKELKEDTSETRKVLDKKDGLIKAKEGTIKEQKKTIRSLNDELSQMQQKNNSLSAEKKDLQDKLSYSEEKTASLEDEIAKVRSNLYDVKEKIKSAKPTDEKEKNTVLAEKKQLKKENEKLKAEMDKNSHSYQESMKEMNYELDSSRNKITELESLLKEANMEVEELKKDSILPFDFDPNTIGAKEIVSERQGLYAATIDNCTVYVDTENYVLQFKKTVRRPSKYAKKLMTWNEESINETYYITASALCCRKTCRSNINDEMQSVLERFASVK